MDRELPYKENNGEEKKKKREGKMEIKKYKKRGG